MEHAVSNAHWIAKGKPVEEAPVEEVKKGKKK